MNRLKKVVVDEQTGKHDGPYLNRLGKVVVHEQTGKSGGT